MLLTSVSVYLGNWNSRKIANLWGIWDMFFTFWNIFKHIMFVTQGGMREYEDSSMPGELVFECSSPCENGQFCLQFSWFTPLKRAQFAAESGNNEAESVLICFLPWQRHIAYNTAMCLFCCSTFHTIWKSLRHFRKSMLKNDDDALCTVCGIQISSLLFCILFQSPVTLIIIFLLCSSHLESSYVSFVNWGHQN